MKAAQLWGKTTNGTRTGHITPTTKRIKKRIKQIFGILLYYSMVLDLTIMVALESVSDNHGNIDETTSQSIKQLLDYCATHTGTPITNKQSNAVLHVHSDESYISEYHARS